MSKGSPIYRREEQRFIGGLVTKRQALLLIIAVFIALVFVNKKEEDMSNYKWAVRAVLNESESSAKTNNSSKTQDDWGALEDVEVIIEELEELPPFDPYDVEFNNYSNGSTINLEWERNEARNFKYEVYLNDELFATTSNHFFYHNFKETSMFEGGAPDPITIIRLFVITIFALVAFLDVNGTHPETYAMRFIRQYIGLQPIYKLPFINLNLSMPYRKQTVFRLGKHVNGTDFTNVMNKKKKSKIVKELNKDTLIEKTFTSYENPIEFTTNLDVIHIHHQDTVIQLVRRKQGGIEVVISDK